MAAILEAPWLYIGPAHLARDQTFHQLQAVFLLIDVFPGPMLSQEWPRLKEELLFAPIARQARLYSPL